MTEKLKKHVKGSALLVLGVVLLFVGAAGVFDLFDRVQESEFVGEEVPRELIETEYSAEIDLIQAEAEEEGEGFVPLFMPVESAPVQALPTLEAASEEELSQLAAIPTPDRPQELDEIKGDIPQDISISPTSDSTLQGAAPLWLYIDGIGLEAPVVPAESATVEVEEDGEVKEFVQWEAPNEAVVGWHSNSARLGVAGNTVLNGHHNAYGRVFRNLAYMQEGDFIQVYASDDQWYTYVVANKMVLPEWNVSLEKRLENAAWILPSTDERLTLITCWPEQSNSHRLIIVARPVHE